MCKRSDQQQKYYFSDKLKKQLAHISQYPLTIVEAPSGFGKTTAVREYLKENLPPGACEYWYTCLGESSSTAWLGICELFSNVDDKTADDLRSLNMPTMDTLFYTATCLRNISCRAETYLVVDNYQLVDCDVPCELISVFSRHGNSRLHMIFITQQVKAEHQFSILNDKIYSINSSSFFFDKEGTSSLFRLEGVQLTSGEAENVYMYTEGWVSAIRLQIINYKESGSLDPTADVMGLVETAIWKRLTPEEKEFLLAVSVLGSFTVRQAAIMMGLEILPDSIRYLLMCNEFIRFIPDQHRYIMHSILRDYLLNRLYQDLREEDQGMVYRRAGNACAAVGEYCQAAHFFYKVKDFDAILSLPFSCEYFDNHRDIYKPEFMEKLISVCPKEKLCGYPFTLLVLGYQTLACGQFEIYCRICALLAFIIKNDTGLDEECLRKVKGEYALLVSMKDYNDITKLKKAQKVSWEILGKPSEIIKRDTVWGYTTPSSLSLFWRESGKLEFTMQQIEEMSLIYRKLTQGQWAGAKSMIRAEAMLQRGEDSEAEILCYKALYEARSYKQIYICFCGELTLARIAILRGDAEGYFKAVKNIQAYGKENSSLSVLRLMEHTMSIIGLILGIKDYVAQWFYDMESMKKVLYAPIVPIAQIFYLWILVMDKRYNELYGVCQFVTDMSKTPTGSVKYLMPTVYQHIFLAIAKRNSGNHLEAQKHLREALDIAVPDQIYLPFAQMDGMESLLSEIGGCTALNELCRRQQRGVSIIRKAVLQGKSPLTPREREIARLAKERLSAREIADKLFIAETTVRTTLRNVYSKLDIHSKAELNLKEF